MLAFLIIVQQRRGPKMWLHHVQQAQAQITMSTESILNSITHSGYAVVVLSTALSKEKFQWAIYAQTIKCSFCYCINICHNCIMYTFFMQVVLLLPVADPERGSMGSMEPLFRRAAFENTMHKRTTYKGSNNTHVSTPVSRSRRVHRLCAHITTRSTWQQYRQWAN